jgi:regulator of sigma E protease
VGDRIAAIDGVQNPNWEEVAKKEALSPNQPLQVSIVRDRQTFALSITPEAYGPNRMGYAGWTPKEPNFTITDLEAGMPAEKAGMKIGDDIVAVNGQNIPGLEAMVDLLKHTQDQPLDLTVLRNGQSLKFIVRPVLTDIKGDQRYRIGIGSLPTKVTTLPFAAALSLSLERNREGSLLILELVQKMVQRKISMKSISGPIGIGRAAGQAASEKGWTPLLELTSAISLNLGIFNLLPIPILDGGVILLLLVEGLMRRDISLQIKERIYQAAFVFLVLFAVMVIYNDIAKSLPGLAGKLP